METVLIIAYAYMATAIALEVAAGIFIKYSDGFRRRGLGVLGIACILVSFAALSQAIKVIDLSVAYALWGGFGIVLTATAGRFLFRQRLSGHGWIGVVLIVGGMSVLKMA
jgi:spermidine export protein MdtI